MHVVLKLKHLTSTKHQGNSSPFVCLPTHPPRGNLFLTVDDQATIPLSEGGIDHPYVPHVSLFPEPCPQTHMVPC